MLHGFSNRRRQAVERNNAAKAQLDKRMDDYLARVQHQNERIIDNLLDNLLWIGDDAGAELRKMVYG